MKRILTALMFVALSMAAFAQDHWSFSVKNTSDNEAELILTCKTDDGWHIYSQHTDENGPIGVSFTYNKDKSYALSGTTTEPKPKTEYDEVMKCNVSYFDQHTVVFKQKIKRLSEKDFKVTGTVSRQVCNDGSCVYPDDVKFSINVKGAASAEAVAEAAEEVAKDSAAAQTKSAVAPTDTTKIAQAPAEENDKDGKKGSSLISIFLWALLGGIVTMFTPCVFPMIPMTVNFFMGGSSDKRQNRRQALFFGFSIVALFAFLGAILSLVFGPDALYFIGTHWIPNIIFFIIFIIFSMSFFGMFEIKMPEKWINKSDEQADKGGLLAPFFIALTTVLVSFSCTGPILGAALVELTTSSTDRMVSLLTMLGFGIGFALPFTALALFPSDLKGLKSGGWLNTVKVVFAFLELAFGLKFLQQADLYCGWGILDREVYLALWIVIFAMLGFYLLGKLRFKDDEPVEKIGVGRLFLAILDLAFVVYMIPGLWGAPLKGISGFIPPMETQDFNLAKHSLEIASNGTTATPAGKLPADRSFLGELSTPDGYEAFYDLDEAKAYAKEHHMPIFIDFTGKTCANCREMEHYVWSDEQVHEILSKKFVMCAQYADAAIDLPEDKWVTDKDGNVIKKLDKKVRNYQQTKFNMSAQPYYAIIDENENVLTKENYKYDRDVQKFINYLNEGLSNYGKK